MKSWQRRAGLGGFAEHRAGLDDLRSALRPTPSNPRIKSRDSANFAAACYRALPFGTATSEQTWSKRDGRPEG